jgi:hypothetical protein
MKRWRLAIILAALGAGALLVWSRKDATPDVTVEWLGVGWEKPSERSPYSSFEVVERTLELKSQRDGEYEVVLNNDSGIQSTTVRPPDKDAAIFYGLHVICSPAAALVGTTRVRVCHHSVEEADARRRFHTSYPRLRWLRPLTYDLIEIPNNAPAGVPYPSQAKRQEKR